jgi:hypothetical protein
MFRNSVHLSGKVGIAEFPIRRGQTSHRAGIGIISRPFLPIFTFSKHLSRSLSTLHFFGV